MTEPERIGPILERTITKLKQVSREYTMSLTDQQVLEQRNHTEMIRRPHLWPNGPAMLPMKKRKEGDLPDVAMLQRHPDGYLVTENMSMFGPIGEVIDHIFADAEDILIAGWEVD